MRGARGAEIPGGSTRFQFYCKTFQYFENFNENFVGNLKILTINSKLWRKFGQIFKNINSLNLWGSNGEAF